MAGRSSDKRSLYARAFELAAADHRAAGQDTLARMAESRANQIRFHMINQPVLHG